MFFETKVLSLFNVTDIQIDNHQFLMLKQCPWGMFDSVWFLLFHWITIHIEFFWHFKMELHLSISNEMFAFFFNGNVIFFFCLCVCVVNSKLLADSVEKVCLATRSYRTAISIIATVHKYFMDLFTVNWNQPLNFLWNKYTHRNAPSERNIESNRTHQTVSKLFNWMPFYVVYEEKT